MRCLTRHGNGIVARSRALYSCLRRGGGPRTASLRASGGRSRTGCTIRTRERRGRAAHRRCGGPHTIGNPGRAFLGIHGRKRTLHGESACRLSHLGLRVSP
jgi:hypothetical protein